MTLFSSGDDTEIVISASAKDYRELAEALVELVTSQSPEILVKAAESDPQPHSRCLSGLRIMKSDKPLLVSIQDAVLCIFGTPGSLHLFARNLPVESTLPSGYHVHFDALGREEHVSSEWIPLILSVVRGPK